MTKEEKNNLAIALGGGALASIMIGGLFAAGGFMFGVEHVLHPAAPPPAPCVTAKAEPETPKTPEKPRVSTPAPEVPKAAPQNQIPAEVKIAVVDYRVIMENLPDIKAMNETLEEEFKKIQEEGKNLTGEEQSKFYMERQEELSKMERELFEPIKQRVDDTLDSVMARHGLAGVVNKGAMIRGGFDITEEVKAELGI